MRLPVETRGRPLADAVGDDVASEERAGLLAADVELCAVGAPPHAS